MLDTPRLKGAFLTAYLRNYRIYSRIFALRLRCYHYANRTLISASHQKSLKRIFSDMLLFLLNSLDSIHNHQHRGILNVWKRESHRFMRCLHLPFLFFIKRHLGEWQNSR